MGLFCSLILGLIIKQIAMIPGFGFLMDIAAVLQSAPVVGAYLASIVGVEAGSLISERTPVELCCSLYLYRNRRACGLSCYSRMLCVDDRFRSYQL